MILRLLLLGVAPLAAIGGFVASALHLALAPAFEAIAVCTQWAPRRD